MSELRFETLTMPGAALGPENPLPPLQSGRDLHVPPADADIPAEMLRNLSYGRVPNILPYTMQDGYTRQRAPRTFSVAVLENEILRATFLLEYGGRLWSLYHKPAARELLYVNPVFQPANLALRNAWFSGGVEWNIGTTGHSPFTCAPLFAARVESGQGFPVLRMYEWERIRRVPFQLDAYLPPGSPVLLVRIAIRNPHAHEVPMYWWSNIAVPETPETRVLVPAEAAFSFGYGKRGLRRVPIPEIAGVDVTYPVNVPRAADFFFDLPEGAQPWICALDGEGRGLCQASTARLRGRKLFVWGMGAGGRRWQSFLAQPGCAYLEIQAGLARTQLEHLPMPAGAEWAWGEAYGLLEAPPDVVHGADWPAARQTVADGVAALAPPALLQEELERSRAWAMTPPVVVKQTGSGWGALEARRRSLSGEPPAAHAGIPFAPETTQAAQAPWLALLEHGELPPPASQEALEMHPVPAPSAYMVQAEWRELLEASVARGHSNWFAWLHLGVMRYYAGEKAAARAAWEASLAWDENAWALRNLALLSWEEGRYEEAALLYWRALAERPGLLPLAVECGQKLLAMERAALWLELLPTLPEQLRQVGRIRLLEGQAALAVGDLERVRGLFTDPPAIEDLREGERSLSELWFAYHAQRLSAREGVPVDDELRARVRREYPVPEALDFRMS